jgi:subtilisin family serine protease
MATFSGFLNPTSSFNDRVKPEVVAPGTNITSLRNSSNWLQTGSGTSYSAPAVAGTAALMMQRDTRLQEWPEIVKAVLMATAWQNIEGSVRLSTYDGAGGIQADRADDVTRGFRGGWSGRNYNQSSPTNFEIRRVYLVSGRRARVVICWNQDTNYSQYASRPAVDLDLQILRPNGTVQAGSYSYDNTYEIAEFTPTTTGWHSIRARRLRTSGAVNGIGMAWYQP